jgi:hypothetical protein
MSKTSLRLLLLSAILLSVSLGFPHRGQALKTCIMECEDAKYMPGWDACLYGGLDCSNCILICPMPV